MDSPCGAMPYTQENMQEFPFLPDLRLTTVCAIILLN